MADKYPLVEVRFVMDGEALPTVLRDVQRGQTTVVFAGAARPGRTVTFTIVGSEVRGLEVPIDGHLAVTVEDSVAGSAR